MLNGGCFGNNLESLRDSGTLDLILMLKRVLSILLRIVVITDPDKTALMTYR
jgi:hypothetical protein